MSKQNLLKQDINFLEHPLWFQDRTMADRQESGFTWRDREGFIYQAGYKPPVYVDGIILLCLLLQSQKEGWKEKLVLSRYELLKACGMESGNKEYKRLEESLRRWKMVGIEFQGTFYDGKEYQTMHFGIIDSWWIEKKSKKLHVCFSSQWLMRIKESNYFKMIDFQFILALRSPLAMRLFELLTKTFQGRDSWEIDALKLAKKIPMKQAYISKIIPKIEAALQRINEKTDLRVALSIRKPKRGKAILHFQKLPPGESPPTLGFPHMGEKQQGEFLELLALLPQEQRNLKTVKQGVSQALTQHGIEYVKRNILYSNLQATRNPRAYLLKSLERDWAAGWWEQQSMASAEEEEKPTSAEFLEEFVQEIKAKLDQCEQLFLQHFPEEELELMWSFAREQAGSCGASDTGREEFQAKMKMVTLLENRLKACL